MICLCQKGWHIWNLRAAKCHTNNKANGLWFRSSFFVPCQIPQQDELQRNYLWKNRLIIPGFIHKLSVSPSKRSTYANSGLLIFRFFFITLKLSYLTAAVSFPRCQIRILTDISSIWLSCICNWVPRGKANALNRTLASWKSYFLQKQRSLPQLSCTNQKHQDGMENLILFLVNFSWGFLPMHL